MLVSKYENRRVVYAALYTRHEREMNLCVKWQKWHTREDLSEKDDPRLAR